MKKVGTLNVALEKDVVIARKGKKTEVPADRHKGS
jgi:hypothetical protein